MVIGKNFDDTTLPIQGAQRRGPRAPEKNTPVKMKWGINCTFTFLGLE